MKHCKTCENCTQDLLSSYIKGIDYNQCVLDGHHIEEPFWEKCDRFKKSSYKNDKGSSFLYYIVRLCKGINGKSRRKGR